MKNFACFSRLFFTFGFPKDVRLFHLTPLIRSGRFRKKKLAQAAHALGGPVPPLPNRARRGHPRRLDVAPRCASKSSSLLKLRLDTLFRVLSITKGVFQSIHFSDPFLRSFSAVSTPIFAIKAVFFRIFRALHFFFAQFQISLIFQDLCTMLCRI